MSIEACSYLKSTSTIPSLMCILDARTDSKFSLDPDNLERILWSSRLVMIWGANQCWTRYIGECMVPIININSSSKEPTCGYQNCNTSQIFIFGGYVKGEILVYPSLQVITLNHVILIGGLLKVYTISNIPKLLSS